MTIGAAERLDCFGAVVRPLDEDRLLDGLRRLVDQGARGFVVSLLFGYLNPVHERRIRELITAEYPEAYLGAMPIMLSSEVNPKRWEYSRTNTAILNAYLHQSMWEELSGLTDELRERGYTKGIMLVHNTGGMAEVYRTAAVQTYNGGPVAGLIGASAIGRRLGYDNVLVTDMGGTSFDLGLVVGRLDADLSVPPDHRPLLGRHEHPGDALDRRGRRLHRLDQRGPRRRAGRRARAARARCPGRPRTRWAAPSRRSPTRTSSSATSTRTAISAGGCGSTATRPSRRCDHAIAGPLGIDVDEAALRVRRTVDANMADVIARETFLRGYDPKDFILFAYGGAGPTHCIGYGGQLGLRQMVVFPFSPVFCAWGSSTMPIVHMYERLAAGSSWSRAASELSDDYETFNQVVDELVAQAERDLRGEGYDPTTARVSLALDMKYGGQIHIHRAQSPRLRIATEEDVRAIYDSFEREYAEVFSPVNVFPQGGVEVHDFVVRVEMPDPAWTLAEHSLSPGPADDARIGRRPVDLGCARRARGHGRLRPDPHPRGPVARWPGGGPGALHDDRRRPGLPARGRRAPRPLISRS